MSKITLLAAKDTKFASISIVPANIRPPYDSFERIENWCKSDARSLFKLLRKNLPTGTYQEFRRLIHLELLKDSE